ncbi:MAG TPA: hypothetical protein P5152_14640 [Candidatus Paceibacterota bacterium]|nr:hypothetical protein [Candidatus Paceibacterota bacterium]
MNFIDPMAQVIFNILVTLCGLLGGYVLKSIQATLANMLREQRDLANKLQAIEVLVAGEYVRKDEFTRVADALFARFDRIESKLDNKEDRHP